MKMVAIIIPVFAIVAMVNTGAIASTVDSTSGNKGNMGSQKNECLLLPLSCPNKIYMFKQRRLELQTEINKGLAVYTDDEIQILKNNLRSIEKIEYDK